MRYQSTHVAATDQSGELAFPRLRLKAPDGDTSKLIEQPIMANSVIADVQTTSERFRFSAAVVGFGQLLRGGKYTASFDYGNVLALARGAKTQDPFAYRGEFLQLVSLARTLSVSTSRAAIDEPSALHR